MLSIQEFTRRDLRTARDWDFLNKRDRYNDLRRRGTRYRGIDPPTVSFETFSSEYEHNGIIYDQQIVLLDFDEAMDLEDMRLSDKVKLLVDGDLMVSCTCLSFLYHGFAYILTTLDANASAPEDRYPDIRNPGLRGVTCKHLALVLDSFAFITSTIMRDLRNQGYE